MKPSILLLTCLTAALLACAGLLPASASSSSEGTTKSPLDDFQAATSLVTTLYKSGALDRPVESARALLPIGMAETFLGALAGITLVGAFKLGLFMVTSFYMLTSMVPASLALFGLSSPFLFRSVKESIPILKNMDETIVARSIDRLPDATLDLIAVKGAECRARAICEAGEFMAKKLPWMARVGHAVLERIRLQDGYTEALWRGLGSGIEDRSTSKLGTFETCIEHYTGCATSPFKKITNMSFL